MNDADFRCVAVPDVDGLTPHLEAWEALADSALDDNVYLSPVFVRATLGHLAKGRPEEVVFVYRNSASPPELVGVAPMRRDRASGRAPIGCLTVAVGGHGYLAVPLLKRDWAAPALGALLGWVDQRAGLLRLDGIPETSGFWPLLKGELARLEMPHHAWAAFARPRLRRHPSFLEYLETLTVSRRKGFRRALRRLAEAGPVNVRLHRDLSEASDLARRFLNIEALGWKGKGGTALLSNPGDTAFFEELVGGLAARRRLFFVEVMVGDRPAAITANFVAGNTLFAFKIGHDPAFEAASPGMIAEIETVRLFHEGSSGLTAGDGGTHDMSYLASYWKDLVPMHSVLIAGSSRLGRAFVRSFPTLSRLSGMAQRLLRIRSG